MPGHYKIIYHGRPRLKPTVRVKADLKKRLRYSLQHKGYRSRFKCTLQSYAYRRNQPVGILVVTLMALSGKIRGKKW